MLKKALVKKAKGNEIEVVVNKILAATAHAAFEEISRLQNSSKSKVTRKDMNPPPVMQTPGGHGGSTWGGGGGYIVTVWDGAGNFAGSVNCSSLKQAQDIASSAKAGGAKTAISYGK